MKIGDLVESEEAVWSNTTPESRYVKYETICGIVLDRNESWVKILWQDGKINYKISIDELKLLSSAADEENKQ